MVIYCLSSEKFALFQYAVLLFIVWSDAIYSGDVGVIVVLLRMASIQEHIMPCFIWVLVYHCILGSFILFFLILFRRQNECKMSDIELL